MVEFNLPEDEFPLQMSGHLYTPRDFARAFLWVVLDGHNLRQAEEKWTDIGCAPKAVDISTKTKPL